MDNQPPVEWSLCGERDRVAISRQASETMDYLIPQSPGPLWFRQPQSNAHTHTHIWTRTHTNTYTYEHTHILFFFFLILYNSMEISLSYPSSDSSQVMEGGRWRDEGSTEERFRELDILPLHLLLFTHSITICKWLHYSFCYHNWICIIFWIMHVVYSLCIIQASNLSIRYL